jgi:hypothetical protein
MSQEQAILATDLFTLIGSLVFPLPTAEFAAIDDLRVAVVTSNMGFSSDGVNNDTAWPAELPASCLGFGDNGEFQTSMPANVTITNDVISCDNTGAQCPPGWTCDSIDGTGVGTCHSSTTNIACPSLGAAWAETSQETPNPELATQTACLAQQGTDGCGWEQQLASVTTALTRDEQKDFMVDSHLLVVLVVSDEEDCSMADGAALFAEDEMEDQVNLVCGEHPEHLIAPGNLREQLVAAKGSNAVFFAAVVGVPYQGEQADACQGPGDELGDCLDQDDMQLEPEQPDSYNWSYHPACTRSEGSTEVTRAYPGRRFVQLANSGFGSLSYVYSICNPDWTPAFTEIAATIGPLLEE